MTRVGVRRRAHFRLVRLHRLEFGNLHRRRARFTQPDLAARPAAGHRDRHGPLRAAELRVSPTLSRWASWPARSRSASWPARGSSARPWAGLRPPSSSRCWRRPWERLRPSWGRGSLPWMGEDVPALALAVHAEPPRLAGERVRVPAGPVACVHLHLDVRSGARVRVDPASSRSRPWRSPACTSSGTPSPTCRGPYRTWGYPYTPAVFLAVNLWMLAFTLTNRTFESLVGLGILVAGLAVYAVVGRLGWFGGSRNSID